MAPGAGHGAGGEIDGNSGRVKNGSLLNAEVPSIGAKIVECADMEGTDVFKRERLGMSEEMVEGGH